MQYAFDRKRVVISVLVVVVLIAVLIKTSSFSWSSVIQAAKGIGVMNILLALCLAVFQYICVALRFLVLLPGAGITRPRVCHIFTNGQFFNQVLPVRAGDLYNIVALKHASADPGFSTARVVSALIIERLLSTLVLLVLIISLLDWSAIVFDKLKIPPWTQQTFAALVFFLVVAFVVYLVQRRSDRLRNWLIELRRGLKAILNLRRFLLVLTLGVLMWMAEVLALKVLAGSLGFDLQLGQGLFVLLLLNIGVAIPITMANIGTYEAALVLGLGWWGMGTSEAVAIALVHHALQITALLVLIAMFNVAEWLHGSARMPNGR